MNKSIKSLLFIVIAFFCLSNLSVNAGNLTYSDDNSDNSDLYGDSENYDAEFEGCINCNKSYSTPQVQTKKPQRHVQDQFEARKLKVEPVDTDVATRAFFS